MKKIMFDDLYCLTRKVLERLKNQTRRIINVDCNYDDIEMGVDNHGKVYFTLYLDGKPVRDIKPMYQIGEEVAVAQSYKEVCRGWHNGEHDQADTYDYLADKAGWRNKMFVSAERMPYRIKIANIRVEHLQDISETDCLKEGIGRIETKWGYWADVKGSLVSYSFDTIRAAFAELIDKISGKGTWDRNPLVFIYDFELVK